MGGNSASNRVATPGRDRDFSGALVYGGGLAITAFLAYAFNAAMGRRLSAADFGTFGALLAVLLALSGPTTAFFGGGAMAAGRSGKVPIARWAPWVTGIAASTAVAALLPLPSVVRASLWVVVAAGMWILISWNRGLLIGFGRLGLVGGTIVLEGLARLVLAVMLVARGWRVAGATAGLALGMASAAVISTLLLPRSRGQERQPIGSDVWMAIAGLFFLGIVQFPDVVGVRLFSPAAAGGYNAASSLARLALYAQAPAMAYVLRRSSVAGPGKALRRGVLLAVVPALVVSIVLMAAPRQALSLTYGHRYVAGVWLLRTLTASMFVSGLAVILLNAAMGAGRVSWVWSISIVSIAGTAVVLALSGSPHHAAVAMLGAQTAVLAVAILYTVRLVRRRGIHKGGILIFNWRDTRHPQGGGSEVFVEEAARRLAGRGHEVTVFCADHGHAPRDEIVDGVRFIRRGSWWSVYAWATTYHLLGKLGRHDVVLDVQNGIPFFSPLHCTRPIVVLVHHVHREQWSMLFGPRLARLGWWTESRFTPRMYRRATYVAVSMATKVDLVNLGVDPDRIAIVNNGSSATQHERIEAPVPTLTYLGRLVPHKRVELLLRAAAELRPDYPDLRVRVVGRGAWELRLRATATNLAVQDMVSFEGYVGEEEKRRLLAESWALVLPSIKEGWGLVVMEAAALGTPAVAFRVGGVQEAVVDGQTGLLAVEFEEFVARLREILESESLRRRLGAAARARSLEFSWDATADELERVLEAAADEVPLVIEPWPVPAEAAAQPGRVPR